MGIQSSNQQPLWQGEGGQLTLPDNVQNLSVSASTGRQIPTQIYPDMAPKGFQNFPEPTLGRHRNRELEGSGLVAWKLLGSVFRRLGNDLAWFRILLVHFVFSARPSKCRGGVFPRGGSRRPPEGPGLGEFNDMRRMSRCSNYISTASFWLDPSV